MTTKRTAVATIVALLLGTTAMAQDVNLMNGVEPRPDNNSVVEAGAFQKDGPWTIAMSHFGVNANTWTVQTAHEAQGIADGDDRIANFIMLDANFDQAKQVADIEDLIAQKPDVLIVMPVTSTSADAGMQKAIDAGIPVVVHTGRTENQNFTTEMRPRSLAGSFSVGAMAASGAPSSACSALPSSLL